MATPDEKMLCYCRNLKYGEVRESVARADARKVQQVMDDCTAGTGCRTCHDEIRELIEEHRAAKSGRGFGGFIRKVLGRS